jgi:hypothetical protein
VIGRLRSSDVREKPPDPAKIAKREAKIAKTVQRSLRRAGIDERRFGGGTLLTEPVLVFDGRHLRDFKVFDQDARQLGSVHRSKPHRYRLDSTDDATPIAIVHRYRLLRASYKVSRPDGTEIATLSQPSWRVTHTSRSVMAGTETLGYLKLACFPANVWKRETGRLEDAAGRKLARIRAIWDGYRYVAEIQPFVTGPLRTVALITSILCQDTHIESSGGA